MFNILINDLDKGVESTLSQSGGDTILGCTVGLLEGRKALLEGRKALLEGTEWIGQISGLRPVLSLQLDSMILKILSNLNNSILPAATLINTSSARTCL